jgi:hypothetical protein
MAARTVRSVVRRFASALTSRDRRRIADCWRSCARNCCPPTALVKVQEQVREILATAARTDCTQQRTDGARRNVLGKEIDNLVSAIATIGLSPALRERLGAAEWELDEMTARQARRPTMAPR